MPKFFPILLLFLLAGCSTKLEFARVDPTDVAVIIGYEVVGGTSISPAISTASNFAAQAILWPVGPLAAIVAGAAADTTIDIISRPERAPVTMVDELNGAVYQSIEDALSSKGYNVSLIRMVPISFDGWDKSELPDSYYTYTTKHYSLGEAELKALDTDAILYFEYRIVAHVSDIEELQSMAAIDLKIDSLYKSARAFSMPPGNQMMYDATGYAQPTLVRMSFEQALRKLTYMQNWPARSE